jgi:hypothetical protein
MIVTASGIEEWTSAAMTLDPGQVKLLGALSARSPSALSDSNRNVAVYNLHRVPVSPTGIAAFWQIIESRHRWLPVRNCQPATTKTSAGEPERVFPQRKSFSSTVCEIAALFRSAARLHPDLLSGRRRKRNEHR